MVRIFNDHQKQILDKRWPNAIISLYARHTSTYFSGELDFNQGIWYSGTWLYGNWYGGHWLNGKWVCGNWHNDAWQYGVGNQRRESIVISPKAYERPKYTLSMNMSKYG